MAILNYIEERPFHPILILYNSLANAKLLIGDFQGALVDIENAIKLPSYGGYYYGSICEIKNVGLANTYYLLGFAKINLCDKDGACLACSKSGELGKPDAYEAIRANCR